ncbi:MAG: DsbA family protein [Acidaminobacteraceae bacterium]
MGEGIIEKLKEEYELKVEWLGLEIHPETPIGGSDLVKRFGKDGLQGALINLNKSGKKYGIEFNKLTHMPNSHNALEAAEYARTEGKLDEFHSKLMKAYFTDSEDIGALDVLIALGNECDLDTEKLKDAIENKSFEEKLNTDAKSAKKYGVNSTPTFIINDKYTIVGAQPIDAFRRVFDGNNDF